MSPTAHLPTATCAPRQRGGARPVRRATAKTVDAEPETYNYRPPAKFMDGNIEYRITKHLAIYGTARNLLNDYRPDERYGPSAPAYSRLRTLGDQRRQFMFGVRGNF